MMMWAQVAALSWPEFCQLWKDYIDAMSHALRDVSTATDSTAAQRLARLVYETGAEAAIAGWPACLPHVHRLRCCSSDPCASACAHQIQAVDHSAPAGSSLLRVL